MPRVLCTALSTETGPHLKLLADAGFEVIQAPRDQNLYDWHVLQQVAQDIDGVITGSEPWPRALLEQCPRLRVLSRTGVGYDAIDLPACCELGVVVATTPGVNHHAVAEHTIALLFGVSRGFPERDQHVRAGTWHRFSTPRVQGTTLGIIGLGRIGRAVATRARGLGMRVIAHDPYPQDEFADQWNVELVSLEALWPQSDYVTLHLPANQGTRHVINARSLSCMKRGSVLINTARGALVDEAALVDALRSGHLRGAGLDVFEVEPLPLNSSLLSCPNVLLSGHLAGLDHESQFDTLQMSADTIIQLAQGRWPQERIRNFPSQGTWSWSRG
jgi:D-3-phosphoglycerate dehydrogenase / 2-oxoglutarate reductase